MRRGRGSPGVDDALFWDGDTAAAAADVRRLETTPAPGARALCRLGLWSLARGTPAAVRRWSGRLRALGAAGPDEQFNGDDRVMCADLLDAWLGLRDGRPDIQRLLDRTDSLYLASDILDDWTVTNLVTARLREAIGDTAGAARVIARVPVALPVQPRLPEHLSAGAGADLARGGRHGGCGASAPAVRCAEAAARSGAQGSARQRAGPARGAGGEVRSGLRGRAEALRRRDSGVLTPCVLSCGTLIMTTP